MCVSLGGEMSEKSNRYLVELYSVAHGLISFQQNVKPQNKPQDSLGEKTGSHCPLIALKSF